MKKLASVSVVVTFVILSIVPILVLVGEISGYEYTFSYRAVWEIAVCVITIAASVIAIKARDIKLGVGYRILSGLLLPTGLITWFFMFAHSDAIYSVFAAPCIMLCAVVHAERFIRIPFVKYPIIVLAVIMFILSCFIYVMKDAAGDLAEKTTVYTELSPDGRYRAELREESFLMDGKNVLYVFDTEEEYELGIIKYYRAPEKADEKDSHEFWDFYGDIENFSIVWKEKNGKMSAEFYQGE